MTIRRSQLQCVCSLYLLFVLIVIPCPTRVVVQVSATSQPATFAPELFDGLSYRCIGPSRGGRVTTVTGIASEPATFYMGSTGGGVWKTTNYGQSWRNVSDGYFHTSSIGAIQVADSDPNVVYVGTGSDGIRSNVIVGRGIYKSTDAGETWQRKGLRDVGQIGAVEVHPEDPDLVYVAAIGSPFGPGKQRGVYRSRDGGDSWENVLFLSEETGAVDLEFCPDNPQIIYASMWHVRRQPWTIISGGRGDGVFKSEDGGDTWRRLGGGLPEGVVGKSDLAVSRADPKRLYVLIEAAEDAGVYRSDDHGETFQLVSDRTGLLDRPFYYTNIDADPSNADVLYVSSTGFYRSRDAGKTWQRRPTPHGDNHDIWINPNDSDLMIQANDGGANVSRDGGRTWSTQRNQPTAELYQVAVDDRFPYWVYAGQQDNSTIRIPSLPPYSSPSGPTGYWQSVGGCETGPAIPKPGNANIVYANCKGRFGRFNFLTGQEKQYYVGAANMYGHNPKDLVYRFQRVSPIHISPHDSNVIYHASQYLHRTTDEGVTWETISPDLTANDPSKQVISGSPITRDITGEEFYSAIYAVQESTLEKGLIWVGANDGPVHVTRDGGKTWNTVTPAGLPSGGRVQCIEPSPHEPGKAYVAVYRYLLDDWQPYIFRTNDYGQNWQRLTTGQNGIPADCPTRVVREDPDRPGLLYAGTEFGMFVSFDDGENWQTLQLNLPVTPVTDIKVFRKDLVLSTMGRSFWILDNLSPLHQLDAQVASSTIHLYQPRVAHRMRYRSSGGGQTNPQYPRPGVAIDYYLSAKTETPLTLEIRDARGKTVRTFSSEASGERWVIPDEPGMREFRLEQVGTPRLDNQAGMNRFVWDMRHPGPWHSSRARAGRGGPLVVPGTYQATLTVGEQSQTVSFEIKMDPRVADDRVTQDDLLQQEALCLKVRDLLGRARLASHQIQQAQDQASQQDENDTEGRADQTTRQAEDDELQQLYDQLVTASGRYPQPKLIDQLQYLASMLDRADQKPGRDAFLRYAELEKQVQRVLQEFNLLLANRSDRSS